MHEPSVLDYVKARLKFWEKSDLRIPDLAEEKTAEPARLEGSAQVNAVSGENLPVFNEAQPAISPLEETREAVQFPWLVLLPALTTLGAQLLLEPPARLTGPAIVLYLISAVLAVWAFIRGDLRPVERAQSIPQMDDADFRWARAAVATPLMLAAFVLFGGNRFSIVNTGLWLLSLILFFSAFARADQIPHISGGLRRFWQSLRRPETLWSLTITRWTLLLVAVLALVAVFRFYRLDTLPIDMVSDHAEKLMDVNDLLNGSTWIFFERNTGREAFQFYWTALVIKLFGLDVSFFSLKLGTVLTGLVTLYYSYRLGGLLGNRWVALYALIFVGVAYWPNVISRIALRFPLYPLFVAPLMFHLIRGLRENARNDFLWAGIWLGIGLNGYTSSRIVPLLVVVAVVLYVLHRQSKGLRMQAVLSLMLVAFMALLVCLPLLRYFMENPNSVMSRSLTRISSQEVLIQGSPVLIFLDNMWAALTMFFYNNGSIWVHSIPFRPALDVVMAALFFLGIALLLARYIKHRSWEDIFLLLSIPILLLPSALSIAFPAENPSLNRTAGAYVPVLVIAALGLEAVLSGLARRLPRSSGRTFAALVGVLLIVWTIGNNYNLFFKQYADNYRASAWNTREIGEVARDFASLAGTYDTYYVVGFPHWIDSRQVAIFAGHIERDPAILPEQIPQTAADPRMKMYLVKPEDITSLDALRNLYPQGRAEFHRSPQAGKDFVTFLVPSNNNVLP